MEKFCSNCNTYRRAEDGEYIVRNKVKRWRCTLCAQRKNVSPYSRKEKK